MADSEASHTLFSTFGHEGHLPLNQDPPLTTISLPVSDAPVASDPPRPAEIFPKDARSGFRHHLRHSTAAEHEAVERAFDPLTANLHSTLSAFLSAQRSAFAALDSASGRSDRLISRGVIDDLLERLDRDLGPMGRATPAPPKMELMAVDYLVLGSRLGTEVLRRDLMKRIGDAGLPDYFGGAPVTGEWRQLCAELDRIGRDSAEARNITFDVCRGFGIFCAAANAARDDLRGTKEHL